MTLLTILLMRDCWSTNQKIFPIDQQRYFPICNFRLWQADGCGELVRPRRTQSSLLLDRWIWERRHQQCESKSCIIHSTKKSPNDQQMLRCFLGTCRATQWSSISPNGSPATPRTGAKTFSSFLPASSTWTYTGRVSSGYCSVVGKGLWSRLGF